MAAIGGRARRAFPRWRITFEDESLLAIRFVLIEADRGDEDENEDIELLQLAFNHERGERAARDCGTPF